MKLAILKINKCSRKGPGWFKSQWLREHGELVVEGNLQALSLHWVSVGCLPSAEQCCGSYGMVLPNKPIFTPPN